MQYGLKRLAIYLESWIISNNSIFFLWKGEQTSKQYSRYGLTNSLYICNKTCLYLNSNPITVKDNILFPFLTTCCTCLGTHCDSVYRNTAYHTFAVPLPYILINLCTTLSNVVGEPIYATFTDSPPSILFTEAG